MSRQLEQEGEDTGAGAGAGVVDDDVVDVASGFRSHNSHRDSSDPQVSLA